MASAPAEGKFCGRKTGRECGLRRSLRLWGALRFAAVPAHQTEVAGRGVIAVGAAAVDALSGHGQQAHAETLLSGSAAVAVVLPGVPGDLGCVGQGLEPDGGEEQPADGRGGGEVVEALYGSRSRKSVLMYLASGYI